MRRHPMKFILRDLPPESGESNATLTDTGEYVTLEIDEQGPGAIGQRNRLGVAFDVDEARQMATMLALFADRVEAAQAATNLEDEAQDFEKLRGAAQGRMRRMMGGT